MERSYTGFVDDRAAGAVRAPPDPARGARRGHRLPRAQSAVSRRPPRPAQARDRADRRAGRTRRRAAHRHLDGHQGHEVRRRVVRLPCQRPLRDRHRERLERARPGRRDPPLRGRVAAVAPGGHVRGVLGAAGAGLGRLRLHGDQPAPVRGRPDQDRPVAGRGGVRRDPRGRQALLPAARRPLEPARGPRAHPRTARDGGDGGARLGGPDRQRPLLLRRLRGPRGVGGGRARRRPRAQRRSRVGLLALAQCGQRRLRLGPHPLAAAGLPGRDTPRPVGGRRHGARAGTRCDAGTAG